MQYDVAVIGGGVVGSSVAYGLLKKGLKVVVLDGNDTDLRASRGNFGLVWLQSKGLQFPRYAELSYHACKLWKGFADELQEETGIDTYYQNQGGIIICFDEGQMEEKVAEYQMLKEQSATLAEGYKFEGLNAKQLKGMIPEIGPTIPGALFSEHDGHCNPLLLLRALHQAILKLGGVIVPFCTVNAIKPIDGGFILIDEQGNEYRTEKTVITAGLGTRTLAPMVGLNAPLEPSRGQILVTERVAPFLKTPMLYARQTTEGTLMLGGSNEYVGYDDSTTADILSKIAQQAVRTFPHLEKTRIVRAWGALRVMTPDGLPLYQQSSEFPGAFVFTCHSGITLASLHASELVESLINGQLAAPFDCYKGERFSA